MFVGLFVLGGLFLVLSSLFFALTIVYITLLVVIVFGIEHFHFKSIEFFFKISFVFLLLANGNLAWKLIFFGQWKSSVDLDPEKAIFIPAGINLGLGVLNGFSVLSVISFLAVSVRGPIYFFNFEI